MRTFLHAALLVGAATFGTSANAQTENWNKSCKYSEQEFHDAALALWNEGGSTMLREDEAEEEERRLMTYTMVVRGNATSWYNKHDWWYKGQPGLSNVIKAKGQYSYRMKGYRNEMPVSDNVFSPITEAFKDAVSDPLQKAVDASKSFIQRHITNRHLWNVTQRSVLAVLCDGWKPSDPKLLEADTYESWCAEPKFFNESCPSKLRSSQQSKCWYQLEEILLDEAPRAGFKHVYYRRMSWQEMKSNIDASPPECKTSPNFKDPDGYVDDQHDAQLAWINWEEWNLTHPDHKLPEPSLAAQKESKNKHIGHRGHGHKGKKKAAGKHGNGNGHSHNKKKHKKG